MASGGRVLQAFGVDDNGPKALHDFVHTGTVNIHQHLSTLVEQFHPFRTIGWVLSDHPTMRIHAPRETDGPRTDHANQLRKIRHRTVHLTMGFPP